MFRKYFKGLSCLLIHKSRIKLMDRSTNFLLIISLLILVIFNITNIHKYLMKKHDNDKKQNNAWNY